MIPVSNETQRSEIEAVSDLIKSEVNVKEIEVLEDASDILISKLNQILKS